jgi:hypothetical protein
MNANTVGTSIKADAWKSSGMQEGTPFTSGMTAAEMSSGAGPPESVGTATIE